MGVVFRAGGAYAFTGEDLAAEQSRHIDLHDFFGASAGQLRQRLLETPHAQGRLALLESWLQRNLRAEGVHPAVRQAIAMMDSSPQVQRISRIVQASGMSERRFTTLFQRQVGMNPKHYARLMRFRSVVDQTQECESVNWSAVAIDGGYCDQAHLSHEFRRFAGMTPTTFMRVRSAYRNHLLLD